MQPLVNDLNALLDQREQAVRRAVAKAGDLAHGLKTPLAILAHEAERARAAGQLEVAAAVRSRSIACAGRSTITSRTRARRHRAQRRRRSASIKESADGLARALHRLHAERGIAIDVRVPADLAVRVQREDLDEMLGNLLDNACKWATRAA